MVTNQDVTVNFRHYGDIVIPKGTRLTHMTAMGRDEKYHFVDEFAWMIKNYHEIANILAFDAKNYGIDIPKQYVQY